MPLRVPNPKVLLLSMAGLLLLILIAAPDTREQRERMQRAWFDAAAPTQQDAAAFAVTPTSLTDYQRATLYLLADDVSAAQVLIQQNLGRTPYDRAWLILLLHAEAQSGDQLAVQTRATELQISAEQLISYGDRLLQTGFAPRAQMFYRTAGLLQTVPTDHNVPQRLALSQVGRALTSDEQQAAMQLIGMHILATTPITLAGADLRWLRTIDTRVGFGDPMSRLPRASDPQTAGRFWANGAAVAPVYVQTAGVYRVTLALQATTPAPTEYQFGLNGQPLQLSRFDQGDDKVYHVSGTIRLSSGLQLLTIWFTNDGEVAGQNRDGVLHWLALTPDTQAP